MLIELEGVFVNPAAVAYVRPDPGDKYAHITTRESNPDFCCIGFIGGQQFLFPLSTEEAAKLLVAAAGVPPPAS